MFLDGISILARIPVSGEILKILVEKKTLVANTPPYRGT
jgi:hypothetical protein